MRNDLTDITVLVDCSGSMASMKKDAEGGLDTFVDQQKALPGRATYTLIEFDTEYEPVHNAIDIRAATPYTLTPRGGTALLYAQARAIIETGERLSKLAEADRPGLVVFVTLTDGEENTPKGYTNAQVKEMVRIQTDVYKWQFIYLGANQDAFAVAGDMGIAAAGAMNYTNMGNAIRATGSNVARMRRAVIAGESVSNRYTDEERVAAASP